ncbi:MAG: tRNA pseudouridine(38-40) synthase TruA [bacterium]|nr:tRNA pseudouridine(38-40) synthase TruA [bacterium]
MNIKLKIQYDGTEYHGWQVQPGNITIQEVLAKAVCRISGEEIKLKGCGRTDAGVHAEGYVCNFRTNARIPAERWPYALNSKLPPDIVCKSAEEAADSFDSNRSAKAKRYIYRIYNSDIPDAFLNRYSWQYKHRLDDEKMRRAAEAFIGKHDFIGFASSGFTVKTTVRTIYSLDVTRDGDLITIDVCGNGFLYNMVRIIAGTLVFAGSGKIKPEDMEAVIASKCRERAGVTAPAHGLCLKEVYY